MSTTTTVSYRPRQSRKRGARLRSRRIRFVLLTQFGAAAAAVFRALTGRVFYNGFDAFTRAVSAFPLADRIVDVDREELDGRRRRHSAVSFGVQAGG